MNATPLYVLASYVFSGAWGAATAAGSRPEDNPTEVVAAGGAPPVHPTGGDRPLRTSNEMIDESLKALPFAGFDEMEENRSDSYFESFRVRYKSYVPSDIRGASSWDLNILDPLPRSRTISRLPTEDDADEGTPLLSRTSIGRSRLYSSSEYTDSDLESRTYERIGTFTADEEYTDSDLESGTYLRIGTSSMVVVRASSRVVTGTSTVEFHEETSDSDFEAIATVVAAPPVAEPVAVKGENEKAGASAIASISLGFLALSLLVAF